MSLSDCVKCWDTPCTCGWGYRYYRVEVLKDNIKMLESVTAFKKDNPDAVFSDLFEKETEDDKQFMKVITDLMKE